MDTNSQRLCSDLLNSLVERVERECELNNDHNRMDVETQCSRSDSIDLILERVTDVNTNLLSFATDFSRYQSYLLEQCNGKQSMQTSILLNHILRFTQQIRDKLDKLERRTNKPSTQANNNTISLQQTDWSSKSAEKYRRCETAMKQQLNHMRNAYHSLRQEFEWSQQCVQYFKQENSQLAHNLMLNNINKEMSSRTCELIFKITLDRDAVSHMIINSRDEFALFIESVTQSLSLFVVSLENNLYDEKSETSATITMLLSIVNNLLIPSDGRTYFTLQCKDALRYVQLVYAIVKNTRYQLPFGLINRCLTSIYNLCLDKTGSQLVVSIDGIIGVLLAKVNAYSSNADEKNDVTYTRALALKSINLIISKVSECPNTDKKFDITGQIKSLISRIDIEKIIEQNHEKVIREEAARLMLTIITPEP